MVKIFLLLLIMVTPMFSQERLRAMFPEDTHKPFLVSMIERVKGQWTIPQETTIIMNGYTSASANFAVLTDSGKKLKFALVDVPAGVKATLKPDSCSKDCVVTMDLVPLNGIIPSNYTVHFRTQGLNIDSRISFVLTIR